MTNYEIAEYFSLLSKLMDIHGEDSFRAKSYSSAAFSIENLPVQLSQTPPSEYSSLKGIGASTAKKVTELLENGKMEQLEKLIASTPPDVIEMISIKGLGPKKINTVWKEMEIETIGELAYACAENRLRDFKGFGVKTQQSIADNIDFYLRNKGNFLYAQIINLAEDFRKLLEKAFPGKNIFLTGSAARQLEIITHLDFVIAENSSAIEKKLLSLEGFELIEKTEENLFFKTPAGIRLNIYPAENNAIETLIRSSSSPEFHETLLKEYPASHEAKDEKEYFSSRKLNHVPAFLREDPETLKLDSAFDKHLHHTEIKGLIHCHSDWSDGDNSIEEMGKAAMKLGMEYMAISDHSKTAFYARGLNEDRLKAQHAQIHELNEKMKPFKIFKSIESDILNDGSLDYSNAILGTFDLVIASVHSNLKMTEEKAMARLLTAIENPYTTILGHMTGRLLLSRPGYPVDYKKIIDACAANNVVIELNANPNRLDMDWREIKYALQKNVLISIDPDAHSIKGIEDIRYGVFSAQKAMLTKEKNLSSFSLAEFEKFLEERRTLKKI